VVVGNLSNLLNFLHAWTLREASSKLSQVERHTQSLGVLGSLPNSIFVPLIALLRFSGLWLASCAHAW
jgi:hypothetical protein